MQCGLARTGALWAHSSLPVECHPDIVTMAKPLANVLRSSRYVKAMILTQCAIGNSDRSDSDEGQSSGYYQNRRSWNDIRVRPHSHSSDQPLTRRNDRGGPLQTRVAHHVLARLTAPNFITNVNSLATILHTRLAALPALFPTLLSGPPRGRGLIQGLPFHSDEFVIRTTKLARERGLLLLSCGKSTVRFVPSLIVTKEEVEKCCDILESCLKVLSEDPVRCPAGLEGSGSKCCDGTGLCKML